MITVLLLTGIEKLVNLAISSDKITQSGLAPLSGKVLRLNLAMPKFSIDVLFNDDHLRFEPVTVTNESVFETPGHAKNNYASNNYASNNAENDRKYAEQQHSRFGHSLPDCTINVKNIAELLNLMRDSSGNLPIEGDYKVLMQVKQLISGFNPDIASKLEPLIGTPLAVQLNLLIHSLKGNVAHTAKDAFNDVADWANDIAGNAPHNPAEEQESNDLKQKLLKLRADVEREEARLAMIKAEQARLKNM